MSADAPTTAAEGFAAVDHDHGDCVRRALGLGEAICARRGARLTSQRRAVLELVWASHEPIGAYDILDRLQARGRRRAAPPTVYRALDFLMAHGLVHRIESRNAYVGCARPDAPHAGQFLLCRRCGRAAEIVDPRIGEAVAASASDIGFTVEQLTVELGGLCGACSEPADRTHADAR